MRKKLISLTALFMVLLLSISACTTRQSSGTEAEEDEEDTSSSILTASAVTSEDELISGQIYILRDGIYYPAYVNAASFDTTDNSSTDTSRTVWFSEEEWESIPTLYEGDVLIYHTDEDFDETFYIERFEYIGWTFGLCNLTQTTTKRYSISYESDDYVDYTSSAAVIMTLGEYTNMIIDTISGIELRAGNITDGGVIIGLEKDATYQVEVYTGTNVNLLDITADRVALTSMEADAITDYDFNSSTTVTIYFPEEYNSGYYAINGAGIFRYVAGDSWDENTDFNIENEIQEDTSNDVSEEENDEEESDYEEITEEETEDENTAEESETETEDENTAEESGAETQEETDYDEDEGRSD